MESRIMLAGAACLIAVGSGPPGRPRDVKFAKAMLDDPG